jgi:hypothetical protein
MINKRTLKEFGLKGLKVIWKILFITIFLIGLVATVLIAFILKGSKARHCEHIVYSEGGGGGGVEEFKKLHNECMEK